MIVVKEGDVDIGMLIEPLNNRGNADNERRKPFRRGGRGGPRVWCSAGQQRCSLFPTFPDFFRQEGMSSHRPLGRLFHWTVNTRANIQSYLTYLKGYMKAVKTKLQETNPDRVPVFEKNAATFAKNIIANFKDYEFYVGESMNPEGMVALLVRFFAFLKGYS
jgi:hypothetical protein